MDKNSIENPANRKHTISLYVDNQPGVLIRISLVFARRGYNIDSLVVSEAHNPAFSRMNIVASGDERTLKQIINQLNKLVDVIHARDYRPDEVLEKELGLIKVRCSREERTEILQLAQAFEARPIDLTDKSLTLQVTGSSSKLDALHKLLEFYEIIEIVRTGKVLMPRGDDDIIDATGGNPHHALVSQSAGKRED